MCLGARRLLQRRPDAAACSTGLEAASIGHIRPISANLLIRSLRVFVDDGFSCAELKAAAGCLNLHSMFDEALHADHIAA